MPYRRAVAATWRGDCKLSTTILSFSSSDQRRRRPVSTTSSRPTWALRLSLFIRTVLNTPPYSARRSSPASPDGYAQSVFLTDDSRATIRSVPWRRCITLERAAPSFDEAAGRSNFEVSAANMHILLERSSGNRSFL
jgi:hypothetical protein